MAALRASTALLLKQLRDGIRKCSVPETPGARRLWDLQVLYRLADDAPRPGRDYWILKRRASVLQAWVCLQLNDRAGARRHLALAAQARRRGRA